MYKFINSAGPFATARNQFFMIMKNYSTYIHANNQTLILLYVNAIYRILLKYIHVNITCLRSVYLNVDEAFFNDAAMKNDDLLNALSNILWERFEKPGTPVIKKGKEIPKF